MLPELDLNFTHLVSVGWRKQSIVPDAHKGRRQDMEREEMQEIYGVHPHLFMHSPMSVVLPVVSDHARLCAIINNTRVADGNTIGITADVFQHLFDPLGWWTAIYNSRTDMMRGCFLSRLILGKASPSNADKPMVER